MQGPKLALDRLAHFFTSCHRQNHAVADAYVYTYNSLHTLRHMLPHLALGRSGWV